MFGILIREGKNKRDFKNIGDYVQSIAQKQFLKNLETCFVEIEELSDFRSEQIVNVIMNGWFTWDCSKFLPPSCINPLFVSFHLTPPKENEFFTKEITQYMKDHEPIGARDMLTMEMMKAHGIDSYFSGCLTLTLGLTYKQNQHNGDVIFVDPYIEFGGDKSNSYLLNALKTIYWGIKHYKKAKVLQTKYKNQVLMPRLSYRVSRKLEHFLETATFYEIYAKRFTDDVLLGAKYRTVLVDSSISNEKKFEMADEMLKEYAVAKLVVTSRLHVAFPCLALETKNIFIIPSIKNEEKDVKRYSGRLKGLEDTVTIMELNNGELKNTQDELPLYITPENAPENKSGYLKYKELLINKVETFIKNTRL